MQGIAQSLQEAIRLHQAGQLADAEAIYQHVLRLAPENADALHLLGLIRRRQGKFALAVELISIAVNLHPENFGFHNNLGLSYLDLGELERAETCFRGALGLNRDSVEAMVNLGNCLRAQCRFDEAIALYRNALIRRPNFVEAHNNLGNALRDQGNPQEAAACYSAALAIRPDYSEAHNNLGILFKSQDRLEEAVDSFGQALKSNPDNVDALCNLASALKDQGRLEEALARYRKSLAIRADDAIARWALVMAQIPLVYTDGRQIEASRIAFAKELADLEAWFTPDRVDAGEPAVGSDQPYYLAYQEEDNRALLSQYGGLCSRIMQRWQHKHGYLPRPGTPAGRIRVGIVSSYIHEHSVWRALTKGWLQHMDRNHVELHLFHLGDVSDDETSFAASSAHACTAGSRTLTQWVEAILASQPDALLYPEIGMDPTTVKLANLRLAPIQIAAWGHPETTGLPTIDFFLSADLFEPAGAEAFYSETLIKLPNLGCHYEPIPVVPECPDLRALGLDGFKLLLCPGTPYKYLPVHDWIWVEIAKDLPGCKLVFFQHRKKELSQLLQQRLHAAFVDAGLNFEDHVASIPWQKRTAYYGLMSCACLCLDTIGFSGFNTAMQAVECGLPIVTTDGRFMRGRFAAGILKRLGVTELIATSAEEFVALAKRIVRQPEYRQTLVDRIASGREILFNDAAAVRAMEDFLVRVARSNW